MRRLCATLPFVFFVACTGSDTKVAPKATPKVDAPRFAVSKPVNEIDCCWCVTKPDGNNEVRIYANEELCEEKSGKDFYIQCKKVHAIGNRCVLATRKVGRKGYECLPAPLKYKENGQVKEISPPSDVQLVCSAGDWFDKPITPMVKPEKGERSLNPNDPQDEEEKDDIFCGCGRDPADVTKCAAMKSVNGGVSILDIKPIPPGETNCLREVCEKLWNFDDFLGTCPRRFQQMNP